MLTAGRHRTLVILSFAAIYLLWGGTFLAIRVAVAQMPPLFTAGVRFGIAGSFLFVFMRLRGQPNPPLIQWRNLCVVGLLMFVLTYGPLFWAQQYVPSGVTSIIEATLPITTVVLEMAVFRTMAFQWRALLGVLCGFSGVAMLLAQGGAENLPLWPCLVILLAGLAWSLGAVISTRLALPDSRPLTAGAEMLIGGAVLLCLSAARGELVPFPSVTIRAALALGYLIIFGSVIAYTAYVWLLGRLPATRVASHAYINPLVAVTLGYFVAGEAMNRRMLAGALIVVASVFLILTGRGVEKVPDASAAG